MYSWYLRRQHCNYMKKEDTVLLEELLTFYHHYICFLVYFAHSGLQLNIFS